MSTNRIGVAAIVGAAIWASGCQQDSPKIESAQATRPAMTADARVRENDDEEFAKVPFKRGQSYALAVFLQDIPREGINAAAFPAVYSLNLCSKKKLLARR